MTPQPQELGRQHRGGGSGDRQTVFLRVGMLAAPPPSQSLAWGLREIGRIDRTLFTLDWLQSPELRRHVTVGLNKGEAKNANDRRPAYGRSTHKVRSTTRKGSRHRRAVCRESGMHGSGRGGWKKDQQWHLVSRLLHSAGDRQKGPFTCISLAVYPTRWGESGNGILWGYHSTRSPRRSPTRYLAQRAAETRVAWPPTRNPFFAP